jgi:hypothetical protein
VAGPVPVELTLTGLAPGTAVTVGGSTDRATAAGTATVRLPAGGAGPVVVTIR